MTLARRAARCGSPYRPEPCVSGAACRIVSRVADVVDVGVVAVAGEQQVAVGRASLPSAAGRAAGVEEPRHIVRRDALRIERIGRRAARRSLPIAITSATDSIRAVQRGQVLGERVGREHDPGSRVAGDVRDFVRMQLRVDRDRAQPGRPAAEQQLEVFGRVLAADEHAVARIEAPAPAQAPASRCARPRGRRRSGSATPLDGGGCSGGTPAELGTGRSPRFTGALARRSGGAFGAQAERGHHRLAHLELLRLAGRRQRELVDEADVARHLVVRDLALAEVADLLLRRALAAARDRPRRRPPRRTSRRARRTPARPAPSGWRSRYSSISRG